MTNTRQWETLPNGHFPQPFAKELLQGLEITKLKMGRGGYFLIETERNAKQATITASFKRCLQEGGNGEGEQGGEEGCGEEGDEK